MKVEITLQGKLDRKGARVAKECTNVFVSYSHQDRRHLNRLRVHLRPLERDLSIDLWHDTRIKAGKRSREEIAAAIDAANVAILLVSADFIASDFIAANELPPLLKAGKQRGMTILPVILGHCRFAHSRELSEFQAVNNPSRRLAGLPVAERERIWLKVSESVEAAQGGRTPAEGWLVANERRVLEQLSRLSECGDGSFLIVEAGDYYVQFIMSHPDDGILYCEAISDCFLPPDAQLEKRSADLLESLGFDEPKDDKSNYSQAFELTDAEHQLPSIAALVVKILADVYSVRHNAKLDLKLVEQELDENNDD